MRSFEDASLSVVSTTFYIFFVWIVAALAASDAARRRTPRGLRLTALLGLASMLAILALNVARFWIMIPIFERGFGMLPPTFAASLVFLLLPVVLIWIWGAPAFWNAIAIPRSNLSHLNTDLRASLSAPEFTVPFQLGLSGAFLYLFVSFSIPSISLELFCVVGWIAYGAWRWSRQYQLRNSVNMRGLEAIPRFWPRLARRVGLVFGFAAVLGTVAGAAWWNSKPPGQYSMNMPSGAHMQMAPGAVMRNVADMTGPRDGKPDRSFTLVAQKTMVKLASGDTFEALTYNGQVPGPELRVRQGELVEVTLQNRDISDGVTIHWHGVNVPNAEDGVAGLTQDAVMPGESHVYRFRANDSGTYWYHSHQHSLTEVVQGLFGAFIVEPRDLPAGDETDIVVPVHVWPISRVPLRVVAGIGPSATVRRTVAPGTRVRLRVINTDIERQEFNLTGTSFRVSAIDGVDVNEPGPLERARMLLGAGGRYDLQFTMPNGAVRLSSIQRFQNLAVAVPVLKTAVVLAPDDTGDIAEAPPLGDFNPANYGRSVEGTVNLQSHFDHEYKFTFDSGVGFFGRALNGVYLINGRSFPDAPPIMVHEGELIKITFINRWVEAHPMHPHGHRMLVLSRNGQAVQGSPWWTDTLNVDPGETYEVALKADNPGIWMDHCHNLFHAGQGMVMHLMYDNVMTSFVAGAATRNNPE
jgi:FtsP/CotA-like multicopper oxidase with cupredoxin domain